MAIELGLEAHVEHTVAEADTAQALGSGDVEALGTPALVALCERAAVEAIANELQLSDTTVGARIDLEHLAPTPVGGHVVARARLQALDGRRLTFEVDASDDRAQIARGTHVRVIVDRARFGP